MGAHFVANILKYNKKSSNFVSRRLVTESLFLTLLLMDKLYMSLTCIHVMHTPTVIDYSVNVPGWPCVTV